MGNLIYKVKDNVEINSFSKDFDLFPGTDNVIFKIVPQPLESEIVQGTLKGIYNNPNWRTQFYDKFKDRIKNATGLKYNKRGEAIMNDKFVATLTNWRIQIDFDDGWIGFTSADLFDQNIYYNKSVLDKFCEEIIQDLLQKDLIEIIEVE